MKARAEKALVSTPFGDVGEIVSAPERCALSSCDEPTVLVMFDDGSEASWHVGNLRPLTDHARALLALPAE